MKITHTAIRFRVVVYVLLVLIVVAGARAYMALPREAAPEIQIPVVLVTTPYVGVSPDDIESLVTHVLERELKEVKDLKEMRSTSAEGASIITLEFEPETDIDTALSNIRAQVDRAKPELPPDAEEPVITEISTEDFPVMIVSLAGDYGLVRLKEVAEALQDDLELVPGVLDVKISGEIEREIQVFVDPERLALYGVTMDDVSRAIGSENVNLPGGTIDVGDSSYLVRVPADYQDPRELEDIVVKVKGGSPIYVKDVARVVDGFKDRASYARINKTDTISLTITKRGGTNLLKLADEVRARIDAAKPKWPEGTRVTILSDMSERIEDMVSQLENNMITGLILVVGVLFFSLGLRNSLFVAAAIPFSMLISFSVIQMLGMTLNMIVLFSLILALGMLVDNAIVIVENIYRHMSTGKPRVRSAYEGTKEVAWPVITSTLTTLAAFAPLVFWPGIMGEFMGYLPKTVIITLSSSLFVALVINPVLCASFMKVDPNMKLESEEAIPDTWLARAYERTVRWSLVRGTWKDSRSRRALWVLLGLPGLALAMALPALILTKAVSWAVPEAVGRLLLPVLLGAGALATAVWMIVKGGHRATGLARNVFVPLSGVLLVGGAGASGMAIGRSGFVVAALAAVGVYGLLWAAVMRDNRLRVSFGMLYGLLATVFLYAAFDHGVQLFPSTTPKSARVFVRTPDGSNLAATDRAVRPLEDFLASLPNVKQFVATVGGAAAASGSMNVGQSVPNQASISVDFLDEDERVENPYQTIEKIRAFAERIPGAETQVKKPQMGPPTGAPVSIEIRGEDLPTLGRLARQIRDRIATVPGLVDLKDDYQAARPEIRVEVDRVKAKLAGVSTFAVASAVRAAIAGKKASNFRDGSDEYDITVRLPPEERVNPDVLERLTVMDKQGHAIPIHEIARVTTAGGTGSIRHKDGTRLITVTADAEGRLPAEVLADVRARLQDFPLPEGYTLTYAGENKDADEARAFLSNAFLIALFLIFMVLVGQFNSVSMPGIILISVVLSLIGVFLGLTVTGEPFGIIMTGLGVISLAGVVVNNAIVLIDFIQQLRQRGFERDEAVVRAGAIRLRPVLLTAITTLLGLLPMAVGVSIDFFGPSIQVGGSSAEWWGPMAVAVCFGLAVATFLTLVVVPCLYSLFDDAGSAIRSLLGRMPEGGREVESLPIEKAA